jgi:hypothetical protein
VSRTHRGFILRSQTSVGSSPGSCLSGGGTETRHATAGLELWPWAMVGGGSKGWTSSGTNQTRVVEVVDGRRGTGSTGEGLQRRDSSTTGASRV